MKTTARGENKILKVNPFLSGSAQEEFLSQNDLLLTAVNPSGKKDILFTYDAEAVRDVVEARVKTNRGELQLDKNRGVPYLGGILGQVGNDSSEWEAWVRKTIEETEGVRGIIEFRSELERVGKKRTVSYTAKIQTKFGSVDI